MSLEAYELGFRYPGGRELFSGLSLSVGTGERVALEARSGRGKTTLCRLLAGYLAPTAGCVLVDGEPITSVGRLCGEASPIQLLPQHPEQAFDPRMRLGASLGEVAALGETAGLRYVLGVRDEWLARMPRELSGGELMRLAMVRALSTRPRYLIADESTAMLDAVTQAELWHVLMELQREEGWGMVVVSHSPALLARVATRRVTL